MNIDNLSKFTASLHTHVRSIYDAQIDAKELCEKIKELGGKGCAITDHGVLSSIEDYRRVFDEYELKLIPGCELYVDGGILGRLHLIVLARNDHGYHGICKMVTRANMESRSDYPVISQSSLFEIMKEYKGDIFALSACIQGVIAAIFLLNQTVEKKLSKLKDKQGKYTSPEDAVYTALKGRIRSVQDELAILVEKRDIAKLWAEKKYTKREKKVKKLEGEEKTKAEKELLKDKAISEKAVTALEEKKAAIADLKKKVSAEQKKLKEMEASIEKFNNIQSEIDEIKKELKSDEEIYNTALATAKEYLSVFGKGRFLAEIQNHGLPEEAICYPGVIKVAKELGLPLVATNDVHMLTDSEDDRLRRCILRSLRFGTDFEEERNGDRELYLKDNYELLEALVQIIDEDDAIKAIKNIDVVFNACDVKFETGKHYPKYRE